MSSARRLSPTTGDKPLSLRSTIVPPSSPELSRAVCPPVGRYDVTRHSVALGAEYTTGNGEPASKSNPVRERLERLCREIVPRIPRGTTGFIFVVNGQPLAAEFFGSEDLALQLLPKLLNSYGLDDATAPNGANDHDYGRNDLEAIEFFQRICDSLSEASGATGSGVGLQTHEGDLLGGGVIFDGLVAHYGVHLQELGTPYRRPRPSIIWPRTENALADTVVGVTAPPGRSSYVFGSAAYFDGTYYQ